MSRPLTPLLESSLVRNGHSAGQCIRRPHKSTDKKPLATVSGRLPDEICIGRI